MQLNIMSKNTNIENKPPLQKLVYTRNEVAEMLGVNPITVSRLTQRGLLRPSRGMRHRRYTLEELQRYLRDTADNAARA